MQSSHKSNLRRFSIAEIQRATNNFSDQNCLGETMTVYRGNICEDGYNVDVAVKFFYMESEFTFQKEMDVLSSIHHENIISLVGYCEEEDDQILVYEFMQNGSLFDCLYKDKNQSHSSMVEQRLEICIGVAKALTYLHFGNQINIIHGDVTTASILLDANFVAKISDFRLTKTLASGPSTAPQMTSTAGCIVPECGGPSTEVDVYAFGVVLLEVLCEIPSWNKLVVLALPYLMKGELPAFVPEHVKINISPECSKACVNLVMECLDEDPNKQHSMNQVTHKLHLALELQKQQLPHQRICRSSSWSCESFSLKDIKIATDDFEVDKLIGEGAFWKCYSGYIFGEIYSGPVSVKRIHMNYEDGYSAFQQEVHMLAVCGHVNIIFLVGYCDDQNEKIIVYKSMQNGSLHHCLYNDKHDTPRFTVEQRLDICIGVAEGLSFLHDNNIIHCNLSANNILLDHALVPSISGIDLALRTDDPESPLPLIMDCKQGYVVPECGGPSKKVDVYAFGVVLLEVLCEIPSWNKLVVLALPYLMKGELPAFVPEHVKINISPECSKACVNLVMECLDEDPNKQPSMNQVTHKLHLALELQKQQRICRSSSWSCESFSLKDIKIATDDFAVGKLIGEGAFWKCYSGYIFGEIYSGPVSVKRIHMNYEDGYSAFQQEVHMLAVCGHVNIIFLVGYCDDQNEKIIVYKSMQNGSLHHCLYNDKHDIPRFTVEQRLDICIGVAEGLSFLHDNNIIHCNLSANNILLDHALVPSISGIDLALRTDDPESPLPLIMDCKQGYVVPECGGPSKKVDVYAFGVVLLEVLCEVPSWNKLGVALPYLMKGALPAFVPVHVKIYVSPKCSKAFANLVMECLDEDPNKRPSMNQVTRKLQLALELQKQQLPHQRICRSSSWSCESFSLKDIKIATDDFAVGKLIGEGAFWKCYSGYIFGEIYSGPVSVKRINMNSEDGYSAFQQEVQMLAVCGHVNITFLVGYCDDQNEKIIVYKSMQNGSLHHCLYNDKRDTPQFTVEQRLDICIGVAEGLSFLHDNNIIHCNLSANNILLDHALVPSISGIDLALRTEDPESPLQLIMDYKLGTEGYVAPECYEPNYQPSPKADVYAFAILLLELLCEKPPWKSLVMLVLEFAMKGVLPRFEHEHFEINISRECSRACENLLRDCLDIDPSKRPFMHQVLDELRLALRLQDYYRNGKDNHIQFSQLNKRSSLSSCKSFLLSDIKKATKDFSNCLGEGAFGKVYGGNIGNIYERLVAVKRMSMDPEQGIPAFRKEIELVSACNHVNIISLVGFCEEENEKILIYELMPNGSLYDYLYTDKDRIAKLTIEQRLDICIGVAKGLYYLHSRNDYVIIHSDLKTDNVLLDQNLVPKISDFGLSRARDAGSSTSKLTTNNIKGTEGYLAPECYEPKYQLSRKADVYSYGVVLLEVLCERPSWQRLVLLALPFIRRGELPNFTPDYVVRHIYSRCSRTCEHLIKDCLDTDPVKRPDMHQVVTRLEEALRLQREYRYFLYLNLKHRIYPNV